MSAKETHLQMIQGIISRMAQNSFSLKGWSITLVSAVFALAAKDTNARIGLVAFIPAIMFWFLDSYYLQQERLFRAVYNRVRGIDETAIDYAMDVKTAADNASAEVKKTLAFCRCLFSITEFGFYVPLLAVVVCGDWILGSFHGLHFW